MTATPASTNNSQEARLTIDGHSLSWQAILGGMQLFGKMQPFLQEVVGQYVLIQEMSARENLSVSSSEMMEAIMEFRIQQQLSDQEKFDVWLQRETLNNDTFQQRIAMGIKLKKLKAAIAEPGLDGYFTEHKHDLEKLKLKCLVAAEESLARQFLSRIQVEAADMSQLANEHAMSESSVKAKYFQQTVQRRTLTVEMREALVEVAVGELVGPLKLNNDWVVFCVEEFLPAELDTKLKAQIEAQLFAEWLLEKTKGLSVSLELPSESLPEVNA